jgi:hypothetical protein
MADQKGKEKEVQQQPSSTDDSGKGSAPERATPPSDAAPSTTTESEEISRDNRQGLLKVLSKAIGIDITTISLPVTLNEPASFLMRLCEAIQYSDLLDKANWCEDPLQRLMCVAVFACSMYAVAERTGKPFNPLLGETYEYIDEEREGFHFIAEQVSHHPPVGACHAENSNWKFWQSQCLKSKFAGNSLDCTCVGTNNVFLKRTEEHYKWEAVKTSVHNIIVGKVWLDHYGDLIVTNKSTGEKAVIHFKQCGWFSKGWHELEGEILDSKGTPCIAVAGKWNEAIYVRPKGNYVPSESSDSLSELANDSPNDSPAPTSNNSNNKKDLKKEAKEKKKEEQTKKKEQKQFQKQFKKEIKNKLISDDPLWTHSNRPLDPSEIRCKYIHDWTAHSMQLVQLTEEMTPLLPSTDSRVRPDRLALEKNDSKVAAQEKHRLEEKQRADKRQRERLNQQWSPRYFKLSYDVDNQEFWEYMGGYWEARAERVKNQTEKQKQQQQHDSS